MLKSWRCRVSRDGTGMGGEGYGVLLTARWEESEAPQHGANRSSLCRYATRASLWAT